MKMVSLKVDKAEREKMMEAAKPFAESVEYPWSTCITLNKEVLEKLGIKKLPEVGETMELYAEVEVKRVLASNDEYGSNRSMDLQLTDIALESEDENDVDYKTAYKDMD